jgi:histidyl-tRNA synthetase
VNNLGTFEERKNFREKLADFFRPKKSELCEDCQRRLETNVFRILDCKNEHCHAIVKESPPITGFLTEASLSHHKKVCDALAKAGIAFSEDPYMVRGLDYYTRTVFELSHSKLGAQDALAAGGRYDSLVEAFGGPKAGAVGFAIGMERLAICLASEAPEQKSYEESFFLVALGQTAFDECQKLLFTLRASGVKALMDLSMPSMKSQMRSADKERCRYAIILGDNELAKGVFMLKNLELGEQTEYPLKDIVPICKKNRNFL